MDTRREWLIGLLVLFLVACSGTPDTSGSGLITSEGAFASRYGFEVDVSEDWMTLTQQTFEEAFEEGSKKLPGGGNPAALAQVEGMIRNGQMELIMNTASADEQFADNITIVGGAGEVPETASGALGFCSELRSELSRAFGVEIRFNECGQAEVGGRPAVYAKLQGVVPGTVSAQYHFGNDDGILVTMTGAWATRRTATFEPEFEAIVGSVRFP